MQEIAHLIISSTSLDFIMAARVLLLVALTGLFAAGWNSDCPQAADPTLAAVVHRPEFQSVAGEFREERKVSGVSQSATVSAEFDTAAIVLPELIAPGTYRVVDGNGRVGWITIAPGAQAAVAINEPKPFYNSQSESGCWYFIRVTAAPVIAVPQTGDAVRR